VIGSLREKLARTRQAFQEKVGGLFANGKRREEILADLEEALILADVGAPTAEKIIEAVADRTRKNDAPEDIRAALKDELVEILGRGATRPALGARPGVILAVGVNGGGKTTTLAKLARRSIGEGKKVLLVAADTFRAAAREQLEIWGERLKAPVVRGASGADPASVVFEAVRKFKADGFDLMLVDTAGRIHTNANLMNELEKVKRVIGRELPGEPGEVLLVLDASTGQNALHQAREFRKFSGLTGIVLTKIDGTAKGGAVFGIAGELGLPIAFLGTGEGFDDLADFSAEAFVDALLS
jgi:fused signal recognition particle receptor